MTRFVLIYKKQGIHIKKTLLKANIEMRTYLANVDWNKLLEKKMEHKQVERSMKKHHSKEAPRKMLTSRLCVRYIKALET